ncbi:sirohydrochlorin chelatase [Geminocystis sp. GBBB08]|uniref:sirohydrochlorin chelatase n=1 Tax=Geminocystis sp. GBBB08 TaxID=2604140 RepID=UPI0027E29AE9|nr:sirohydrochlorin chelatase [Geminocystis sp. GBBB08]MBL1211381.1 sirohydrochlorin chelatase [Geminocystis sp. GBBB08]
MIAYLLVVHGSRNPTYGQQLHKLQQLIMEKFRSQGFFTPIAMAYLELGDQPLSVKIVNITQEYAQKGYKILKILPLFLLSGTHVLEDIPKEVAISRPFSPLKLELMAHLGQNQNLISLLQYKYQQQPTTHRILLTHGTKIPQGNQESEKIAQQLKAQIAYWSISPDLATIINQLSNSFSESIAILPYFLFSGKITEAIANETKKIQKQTNSKLQFIPPLGVTPELIEVIVKVMLTTPSEDKKLQNHQRKTILER